MTLLELLSTVESGGDASSGGAAGGGESVLVIVIAVGILVAGVTSFLLAHGAVIRVAGAHGEGGSARVGHALMAGFRCAVPLVLLLMTVTSGILLGLSLLVVPGIMIASIWAVAAPALVQEQCGVLAALNRSRILTQGARWQVFAFGVVVLTLYWLTIAVSRVAISAISSNTASNGANGIAATLLTAALTTLLVALWWTIQTALYIELRDWKDGPASDRLADIFA